jgi:hypothetical protein
LLFLLLPKQSCRPWLEKMSGRWIECAWLLMLPKKWKKTMAIPQGKVHISMGSSWKVRHPREHAEPFPMQAQVGICCFSGSTRWFNNHILAVLLFPPFKQFRCQDVFTVN